MNFLLKSLKLLSLAAVLQQLFLRSRQPFLQIFYLAEYKIRNASKFTHGLAACAVAHVLRELIPCGTIVELMHGRVAQGRLLLVAAHFRARLDRCRAGAGPRLDSRRRVRVLLATGGHSAEWQRGRTRFIQDGVLRRPFPAK